jgi:hypothetical protein
MRKRGLSIVFVERMATIAPETVRIALRKGPSTPEKERYRATLAGLVRSELSRGTGSTAEAMAAVLGCSERTIYRLGGRR